MSTGDADYRPNIEITMPTNTQYPPMTATAMNGYNAMTMIANRMRKIRLQRFTGFTLSGAPEGSFLRSYSSTSITHDSIFPSEYQCGRMLHLDGRTAASASEGSADGS
jgi:hypothetical protein